jgi:hypothetical protein
MIARRSCDWQTVISVEDGLFDLVRAETRDDVREVRKIKGSVQRPKTSGVLTWGHRNQAKMVAVLAGFDE